MIKTIFIFFSYLAFLLLGMFSSDTVLVENNTPSALIPGERTLVEVNVRKGDVHGFSKLELILPDGFIASPGDIKGASFTFSGDKAKFVWMDLPEEPVFKVSYYIESEPGVEGAYEIKGLFSYVKENIREDIYVPTRTIMVRQPLENPLSLDASDAPAVRIEEPIAEMSCERIIERLADNEYLVRLKVNNNRISGFGKILEILPDNCSTNRDNDGGAVITQDNNSIKFVWFEVPVAPSFEVSYRVLCISDGTVPIIRGQLSYTENGTPFTVDVTQTQTPPDLIPAQSNQTAANTKTNEVPAMDSAQVGASRVEENSAFETTEQASSVSQVSHEVAQQSVTETKVSTQQANSENNNSGVTKNETVAATGEAQQSQKSEENVVLGQSAKTEKSAKASTKNDDTEVVAKVNESAISPVKTVPSAEKGISYKVQILAAHRIVDKSYLKKKFSFEEEYNIEHHNGWVKYTTGNFTQYKDARDARVKITNQSDKLPGPFVTAYNDGERITVQEAILISKQMWYK
jgi:hypothetical protein